MTKYDDPLSWPDDKYLTRTEAAAYIRALGLRMQPATLAKHAWRGDGPQMSYFGAKPYYRVADLRDWLAGRTRRTRSTTRPPSDLEDRGGSTDPERGGAGNAGRDRGRRPPK